MNHYFKKNQGSLFKEKKSLCFKKGSHVIYHFLEFQFPVSDT